MSLSYLLFVVLFVISCSTLHGASKKTSDVVNLHELDIQKIEKVSGQIPSAKKKSKKPTAKKNKKKKIKYKYVLAPKKLNSQTKAWVKYYSKKDRKRFQKFLNRGAKYKAFIQAMLVEYNLPPDLYFLGVLESGYSTSAVSHAGAVGAWQFMRPTGRQYGLSINNYVDERLDPIRSTVAAIKYLKELHRQTRDWKLALAAYNAGPGRVRRAIRRGGKNFWTLSRRRLLPRDTRHYIPQFLAMVHIGKNLKKYGFVEKPASYHEGIHLVTVPSPVRLRDISSVTKVSLARLKKMNPHLKKEVTPPHLKSYDIWVPKTHALRLISKRPTLASKVVKGLKARRVVSKKRRKASVHRVRRGDTLIALARRYRKSIGYLKKRNGLRSGAIKIGQRLQLQGAIRQTARSRKHLKSKKYLIRRGDSLIAIAKRFKTTVKNLRSINKIRGNRILRGQYILVAKN